MGSWTFGYDALNRLTTAQNVAITGPSAQLEGYYGCWGYDNFGNRLYESMSTTACNNNPPLTQWSTYTATNTNRVDADSYDAAGDVINDGSYKYLYDPEGRVCAVWNLTFGTATGYIYDAEGNRVAKGTVTNWGSCDPTVNGVASHLTQIDALGVSNEQFTETDGNGNWQHTNVWAAAKVLATYDASGLHFYMDDPLGSRRVQASYTGVTEQDCLSAPYGDFESCQPTPTEHLFTGKERHAESGNDYFGARYYGSSMARFLSPDSGVDQHPEDPQSWNLYAYGRNNPLVMIDPSGQFVCNESLTQTQCDNVQKSLDAQQANANKLRDKYGADSSQYKDAQRAIDAYGKEGVNNGVTVGAGNTGKIEGNVTIGPDQAKTADNPTGQNITVTMNKSAFDGSEQQGFGFAHEGSHVADASDWIASGYDPSKSVNFYQSEFRAYSVESNLAGQSGNPLELRGWTGNTYYLFGSRVEDRVTTRLILRNEYHLNEGSKILLWQDHTKGGH